MVGETKSRDLFRPIAVAVCKNKLILNYKLKGLTQMKGFEKMGHVCPMGEKKLKLIKSKQRVVGILISFMLEAFECTHREIFSKYY